MNRWTRIAFFASGGILLILLLLRLDLRAVGMAVRQARPVWVIAAVGLLAANVIVKALRWQWMAARLSGRHLPFASAVSAILAGVAAASFSPARSVDLAKPLLLRRTFGVGLATSTAAVLVERFLDGLALVVIFGVALAVLPAGRGSRFHPVLAAAGVLLIAGMLALASPVTVQRVGGWFARLLRAGPAGRVQRVVDAIADSLRLWRAARNLWPLLGLAGGAALLEALRVAAVFRGLGLSIGATGAMLAFSAANLVGILTFIPGGIGVTELSMAAVSGFLLRRAATDPQVAAAVLLDRVLSYYLIVALGAVVLLLVARREDATSQAQ